MPRNWRTRSHLHVQTKNLRKFIKWCQRRGYVHVEMDYPSTSYEVARLQLPTPQGDHPFVFVYRSDRDPTHLTIVDDDLGIVKDWLCD